MQEASDGQGLEEVRAVGALVCGRPLVSARGEQSHARFADSPSQDSQAAGAAKGLPGLPSQSYFFFF